MIFEENIRVNKVRKLLIGNGNFFEKILNVAIFVPQFENHFSVMARDPKDESKLTLMNIWKNGRFMFQANIFPSNRLRNLKGKTLRATSFERAPNVYKDQNGHWTGSEVS